MVIWLFWAETILVNEGSAKCWVRGSFGQIFVRWYLVIQLAERYIEGTFGKGTKSLNRCYVCFLTGISKISTDSKVPCCLFLTS